MTSGEEVDNTPGPVEDYLPLVGYIARSVASKLVNVQYDDIFSYGVFGLLDAMEKFDASRGFKFQTYASTRIRGAIFDELRVVDWVPRSIRSKIKLYNETVAYLEADLNRQPTVQEIAEELQISEEEVTTISGHALQGQPLASLQFAKSSPDEEGVYTLEDEIESAPDSFDADALCLQLAQSVEKLQPHEQAMIALYYYEGETLASIGRILEIAESKSCQIHNKTLQYLARHLKGEINMLMELRS